MPGPVACGDCVLLLIKLLNEFKNNLDKHWDNNPVKFDPGQ